MRRRLEGQGEEGFTLIELVVVVVVLPVVLGGIAAALIAVFSLQAQTTNRLTSSNDALFGAANFNKDVQSASQVTTQPTPGCGAATGQTQLLGLQWGFNQALNGGLGGYETVVSYVTAPLTSNKTRLIRQVCTSGASQSPTSQLTVSYDYGATPGNPVTINPSSDQTAAASGWTYTEGSINPILPPITGITINVTEPASGVQGGKPYSYQLTGLPGQSTPSGSTTNLSSTQNPGCNFASPGSGTYAQSLCFADFSYTGPTVGVTCSNGQTPMDLPIAKTPYSLSFCLKESGAPVTTHVFPTYYSPTGGQSEAFLGNNGFYAGVGGKPALYQTASGLTVVTISNIRVLDAVGNAAANWTVVTGDAESTDTNEWSVYSNTSSPSPIAWSILPNNGSADLWGNACYNDQNTSNNGALSYTGPVPATNASVGTPASGPPPAGNWTNLTINTSQNYLTNATSVLCEEDIQLNKTGTMMLAAQEPQGSSAPQSVTVTMYGNGLEAMFLGVLL
jgi:prepilin-type N-terminal cleavage/methylation domain-containing protein